MRLFHLLSITAASASAVSPMEKVLEMLKKMKGDGEREMKAEQKIHAEITETIYQRKIAYDIDIEQGKEKVATYSAGEEKAMSAANDYQAEVEADTANKGDVSANLEKQTEERKQQRAANAKELVDLQSSENALERAIQVLSAQDKSIPAELIQKVASEVPAARSTIEQFLQDNASQPQAGKEAYGFQSGGIVKLLKELHASFIKQVSEAKIREMNQAGAANVNAADLKNEIELLDSMITQKTELEGESRSKAGEFASKKADAAAALDGADGAKRDTLQYEKTQNEMFKTNQEYRAGEIAALSEAIRILGGPEVAAVEDKHTANAKSVNEEEAAAFIQMSTRFMSRNDRQTALIQKAGDIISSANQNKLRNKSQSLALVMAQMMTGGTFDKIITMIGEMIEKLETEAREEADHQAWCKENLEATKTDKERYEAEVARTTAAKEDNEAELAQNLVEDKELEASMATERKEREEARVERAAQKVLNDETVEEAKQAQVAVNKAVGVLQQFYNKQANLMLQTSEDPQIAAYKGMGDSNGGVLALLETIITDYVKIENDTATAELNTATFFADYEEKTKTSLDDKLTEQSNLKSRAVDLSTSIRRYGQTLEKMNKQLATIVEFWGALQPMCVVEHVSYEERVLKRKEEIVALKDAYKVLEEEALGA